VIDDDDDDDEQAQRLRVGSGSPIVARRRSHSHAVLAAGLASNAPASPSTSSRNLRVRLFFRLGFSSLSDSLRNLGRHAARTRRNVDVISRVLMSYRCAFQSLRISRRVKIMQ
jgi:hypothetical protein